MENIYYVSEINTITINSILEAKKAKIKNIIPIVTEKNFWCLCNS